jgi:WD40 repeat protein
MKQRYWQWQYQGMITGGGYWNSAKLKVWEVEMGIVRKVQGHSQRISCIDIYISEDNTLLVSGSWDSTAQIWNLEMGKLVAGPFESDNGWAQSSHQYM